MRIISRARLREFWTQHKNDQACLTKWYKVARAASWTCFADVKRTLNSVDQYATANRRLYIFNVGGNRVRVIAAIHFNTQIVYVRMVLTHKQYTANRWKGIL
jgi:mRNA interferase HigB